MKSRIKKTMVFGVLLVIIPAVIVSGFTVFDDRRYAFVSMAVAALSFVPFILRFEMKKDMSTKKIIVLAVMVTLSVTGRLIFVFLPFIKPVTAVTVISGIWFGPEIGFLTGSLSALISNFYFGQGPWTPFQMFAWGIIGLFAGLLSNHLRKGKARVALFGLLSGAVFSLVLDVWVVVWADGVFNLYRYLAVLVIGAPATLTYALSNSLFLLVAIKPVGKKLDRIKMKYGL